ncbi:MAG TPA: translation elongation factor-like protein [Candidatus Paceibacterota bacterium]|jgi:putative protease|nr:translation elongation factor-like protein [Candidatus Paceibacterota bacterium]HRS47877.1 translation elongation factor-like protein [Candidatus Paceibacterota bacterium]
MGKLIGKVTHYYNKISVAIIELESEIEVGEMVRFWGKKTDFSQRIESLQKNHQNILKAEKGEVVGVKVEQEVEEGDEVYKIEE